MKKTRNTLLMTVIIFALVLAACANEQTATPDVAPTIVAPNAVVAEGHIKPIHAVNLSFQTFGVVEEINVKIGDSVRQGDVLARLTNAAQAEAQLSAANLELIGAQQALDDLLETSGADLAEVVIDLKEAEEAYDKAVDYLQYLQDSKKVPQTSTRVFLIQTWKGYEYQYKTKNFKGPAPEDWIIEAENDLALKQANFEELQRIYERMKDGADTDQLALLEARLANGRAQVAAAEAALGNYVLTAPFDGEVAEVAIEIGEQVSAESRAISLADTSSWVIETTDITELEVVKITEGQAVTFSADALNEVVMSGNVSEISQSSLLQSGDVIYTVRIQADEVDPRIKWGMTVEITFESLGTN